MHLNAYASDDADPADLSSGSSDLESLTTDEQSSSRDVDASLSPGRTDAGTDVRKVGVAARFVSAPTVSTPCPKSSLVTKQSRHSADGDGRTRHHERPSSSSESVPDGYSRVARCLQPTSELDERRLVSNCQQLNDSQFYVAELSSTDAKRRLRGSPPGTFLVRDSAHPRHLYSLTVKTQRGVTSIRTVYDVDGFRLDSDPQQAWLMPSFDSVVALVNHYVTEWRESSQSGGRLRSSCVFVDSSGHRQLPVILSTPYRSRPTSLRHLCRLAINTTLDGRPADRLCLVPSLREFLKQHPFIV